MTYKPTYLPDGRKAYDPSRTERDTWDEREHWTDVAIERDPSLKERDRAWAEMRGKELWRQEEEAKQTWREWQDTVWRPRMQALAATRPSTELTAEEWAHLADILDGANHPLAQSIHIKAKAHLT